MNDTEEWLDRQVMEALDPGPELRTAYDMLRPAERAFVDQYTVTLDPKLAARSLGRGGAVMVARVGDTNLAREYLARPLVLAAIADIFAARRARYEPTVDRIVQELSKIAFASLSDFMKIGGNGEPYYDFTGVSAEGMAALAEVTIEDFTEGRGEFAREVRRIKVKQHDKLSALTTLAKLLGAIAPDNHSVNVTVNALVNAQINNSVTLKMTEQEAADVYARTLDAE